MKPRKIVFWLLLLGMFIYEGYALLTPEAGDTISEITWGLVRHPLIPFLLGLLMGHFIWQRGE